MMIPKDETAAGGWIGGIDPDRVAPFDSLSGLAIARVHGRYAATLSLYWPTNA